MTHELDPVFAEWQAALAETAVASWGGGRTVVYKRAASRAAGLAQLTTRYSDCVTPLEMPTFSNMLSRKAQSERYGRHLSNATAVADTQRSITRLSDFYDENAWLASAAAQASGREKALLQNAAKRYRGLPPFIARLRSGAGDAYFVQMSATVEPEYVGALLRQEPALHPAVTWQQSAAIVLLRGADIPLSYSTALLTPETLTEAGARQVIELFTAGISAEFAGATL